MNLCIHQFNKTLQDNIATIQNNKVAIAVSGGVDSMCLINLTKAWADDNNIEIVAIIIDHGLRKESQIESEVTRSFLEKKGIEVHVGQLDSKKIKAGNIQQNARDLRYEYMGNYCKEKRINNLLVGHHKNDQAETVMLRILRGSGVDGLSAMDTVSNKNGVCILRPMLSFSRADIEKYMKSQNWQWVEDPSNHDEDKFERVRIRKLLAEYAGKDDLVSRLCLLSNNMRRTKTFIKKVEQETISNICKFSLLGDVSFNKHDFIQLDEEIALRVLRELLIKISGNSYVPRLNSLQQLYSKMIAGNFNNTTLSGCEVILKGNSFCLLRELVSVQDKAEINVNRVVIWDNRVEVQVKQKNLYIGALGQGGYDQLKQMLKTLPHSKWLYPTPAVFDQNGILQQSIIMPALNKDIEMKYFKIDIK